MTDLQKESLHDEFLDAIAQPAVGRDENAAARLHQLPRPPPSLALSGLAVR